MNKILLRGALALLLTTMGTACDDDDGNVPGPAQTNPDGTNPDGNGDSNDDELCVQLELRCTGIDVEMCLPDGSWTFIETCGLDEACDAGAGGCVCVPNCDNLVCGDDGCGGSCGDCPPDLVCDGEGQCGDPPSCDPLGTGTTVGATVADMTWTIQDGSTFNMHSLCQTSTAIVVVETAGW